VCARIARGRGIREKNAQVLLQSHGGSTSLKSNPLSLEQKNFGVRAFSGPQAGVWAASGVGSLALVAFKGNSMRQMQGELREAGKDLAYPAIRNCLGSCVEKRGDLGVVPACESDACFRRSEFGLKILKGSVAGEDRVGFGDGEKGAVEALIGLENGA
jgi:hypothetical protein